MEIKYGIQPIRPESLVTFQAVEREALPPPSRFFEAVGILFLSLLAILLWSALTLLAGAPGLAMLGGIGIGMVAWSFWEKGKV